MKFQILTLFPEMFESVFASSILSRGQEKGLIKIETKNIRDFASGKRKNVDDKPFGGGAGMLMMCEPLFKAIESAKKDLGKKAKVIYFTAQGKTLTQSKAKKFAESKDPLILLCGHFEGIDERVREKLIDEEISIGDYVLTGGEIPAMTFVDCISRLIPGVVGKKESVETESFSEKLFFQKEFPQYTRPANFKGMKVPEVLLSGNHAEIVKWQMEHLRGLSDIEKKILKFSLEDLPFKSKNLIFRLPKRSDIDLWMKWMNDKEVTKWLVVDPPVTREFEEQFFEDSAQNLEMLYFMIQDKKTKKPIGGMTLEIESLNKKAAGFGFQIGEKDFWGKGLGTEIMQTMLRVAFEKLDLVKINSSVFADNKASKRVHEKCGFREVGTQKKEFLKKSGFSDKVILEVLKNDWNKR